MNKKALTIGWLMVLPGCLFVVFFMLVPLFLLVFRTFFDEGGSFTLNSYWEMFQSTYFQQVFVRSLKLSLISTAICALLGFPSSYYIAKYSRHKGMLMAFAVFPMFTSPVIRSFSWIVLLGKKGMKTQTPDFASKEHPIFQKVNYHPEDQAPRSGVEVCDLDGRHPETPEQRHAYQAHHTEEES